MIKKLSIMTLEEAIKHCEEKACGNTECAAEHKQLAEWLKELQAMKSIPSNLDELAEEYADYNSQRWHEDGDVYYDHSKIMDAFKAGAEWMAGQFQRVTGDLLDWHQTSDGREFCSGIVTCELFEVPEGFYIRKK